MMYCHSDHPEPVKATSEITLYERPSAVVVDSYKALLTAALTAGAPAPVAPRPRAVWRGYCCDHCTDQGLALLKRRSPEHCLLLVLPVRE